MRIVNPPALGRPAGYSNGVLAPGGLLCVAGQVAWDAEGRIVGERFADQFDRALENVLTVVAAAGGTPDAILRLTIYVTDLAEYSAARRDVGERYRARMGRHYPAMTVLAVTALLEEGARVELEATAWISAGTPGPETP